jgi:hypothetical protein
MALRTLSFPLLVLVIFGCSACANLCARKSSWFDRTCAGTDVAHSDPMCEHNLDKCTDGQKAAFEAYVECLEANNQCSLDIVAGCASRHPGGVNLMCKG